MEIGKPCPFRGSQDKNKNRDAKGAEYARVLLKESERMKHDEMVDDFGSTWLQE